MKNNGESKGNPGLHRRDFGRALGTGALLGSGLGAVPAAGAPAAREEKTHGFIQLGFCYPPTAKLDKEGYYSWPGKSFDAEGRQELHTRDLRKFASDEKLRLEVESEPIDTPDQVSRFLAAVQRNQPDGLLLIPYKKSHVENVMKIIDETKLPTVVFGPLGILLNPHVRSLNERPAVYVINSLENLEAVHMGMKMIQTRRRMKDSLLVDIAGEKRERYTAPLLGTTVQKVPLQDFYGIFARTKLTPDVEERAQRYLKTAVRVDEPSEKDVYEAAKCYNVLKEILEREKGDAFMMTCLPGLKHPHKHVPPCMGFMDLRDEGIPSGCESDLDATLTMMIEQYMFGKPSFQHNPTADTERNLYFGAHCTSASKMHGPDGPTEPYTLRSHAEAGWGCVPGVLFPKGQKVTFGKFHSRAEPPDMVIYSGVIAGCPPNPPCGGCRTNMELVLDGLERASDVKSHHLCMCYGDHAGHLRTFCKMFGIVARA